ncbi:MAG: copper amine oxidase N-terminal domain-containing protein [Clostridia bacterium]|nr:copper amine oxidase N-terminal domain-containing protein [Clostridia bacterium]
MGINVYWDEYQANAILRGQQITCTKNGTIIQFSRTHNDSGANKWTLKKWVDVSTSDTNYESIDIIEQQPIIVNDTAYLPLRVISESFGAHVNWIGSTRTVNISCDTSNTCWYDKTIIGLMEGFTQAEAQTYVPDYYSNVVPDMTPYFVPESKFYLFHATDMYGAVKVRIYYGGYIDVFPDTDNASGYVPAQTAPVVETPAEAAPAEVVETPAEAAPAEAVETPAETAPTEAVEAPAGETTDEDEPEVFTFDMTTLLGGDTAQ